MQKFHSVLKIEAALVCGHILDTTSCIHKSLTSELGRSLIANREVSEVNSRITSPQQLKESVYRSGSDSQL